MEMNNLFYACLFGINLSFKFDSAQFTFYSFYSDGHHGIPSSFQRCSLPSKSWLRTLNPSSFFLLVRSSRVLPKRVFFHFLYQYLARTLRRIFFIEVCCSSLLQLLKLMLHISISTISFVMTSILYFLPLTHISSLSLTFTLVCFLQLNIPYY